MDARFIAGTVQAISKRGISEETAKKFGYRVGQRADGQMVQIAEYRDAAGDVVAQHTRTAGKDFAWIGDAKEVTLWGQHLWRDGGRRVVITEGEIDAMSVSQAFGNTWPVVSLPNGAQTAKKHISKALEWLESYAEVVLMFDEDEPGRAATAECVELFSPGKVKVARLAHKDANEALTKDGIKAVTTAVYEAKTYRPDGIVTLEDIEERVLKPTQMGLSWPWPKLTEITYGRRYGEIIGIGAGTSAGKTDTMTECISHDINALGLVVGVVYLEQGVGETGKRVAGKMAKKRFHVPGAGWTQEELAETWGKLKDTGRLHLYDAWGSTSWEVIRAKIRYMVQVLGCQTIYLDHLTALAASEADENIALKKIMSEMAGDAHSLKFVLHFASHLSTADGTPHEEGGRVMVRHFRGSRTIGMWAHILIGLERNQQADDEKLRSTLFVRCLKERLTGSGVGQVLPLLYDRQTGMLNETTMPKGGMEDDESGASDF